MIAKHAQPDAATLRLLQKLWLAFAHLHRELTAAAQQHLGGLGPRRYGHLHHLHGQLLQLGATITALEVTAGGQTSLGLGISAHAPYALVPPTVIAAIFTLGVPIPTGTDWPSLPQVQMPSDSAKSFPSMLT